LRQVGAGADTIAITFKAVLYHVLKSPAVLSELLSELDHAALSFPVAYEQASQLKYLEAVVRESLRIHPPVGQIIQRVVPDTGLTLPNGQFIPPGIVVGMNPWVLSRNKAVFGDDVDIFRPERWLRDDTEDENAYEARLRGMNKADLTFGSGNRVCLGKSLAEVELFKAIPTLFSMYSVRRPNI
jgi:cytochrome P450